MRPPGKRNFSLAVLLAALVAAGALVPIAWQHRRPAQPTEQTVRAVPAPSPAPAPAPTPAPAPGMTDPAAPPAAAPEAGVAGAPATAGQETQVAAAAPGTEEVPAEESETDR